MRVRLGVCAAVLLAGCRSREPQTVSPPPARAGEELPIPIPATLADPYRVAQALETTMGVVGLLSARPRVESQATHSRRCGYRRILPEQGGLRERRGHRGR
jgi:hypothetical protein